MLHKSQASILIVDDDLSLLNSIRRQLHGHYDCIYETDPLKALDTIRRQTEVFAVVISDMYMPNIDGLKFLSQVRHLCPESVCVVLTGGHDQEVAVKALNERYIFRYLQKPCPPEDLKSVLEQGIIEHHRLLSKKSFTYRMEFINHELTGVSFGPGCLPVTGRRGDAFIQNPGLWKSAIHSQDRDVIDTFLNQIYEHQTPEPVVFRLERPDHRPCWIRNTIFSQHLEPETSMCRIQGLMEDITETMQIDQTLQRTRRRYEKIIDNVPDMIFQCLLQFDGTFRFDYISSACRDMFGLEPEDVCADSELLLKSFLPDDLAHLYKLIAESAATLSPLTWQGCRFIDGSRQWYQATARPERLPDGQVRWDGVLTDITEMKQARDKVDFLAQFPSQNPNPVLRVSSDGKILYANEASRSLMNLWERSAGQQVPESLYDIMQRSLDTGKVETSEIQFKDRYIAIVLAPIKKDAEVNLYARDITKMRNAEMELIRANQKLIEHDKLKSEFVSTVSHELRTPLCIFNNIISNALAGVMGPISARLRENLETAQQSIQRLTRIIAAFLDISKIEAGAMKLDLQRCFMQDLIAETVKSMKALAQAKKVNLSMNMPKAPVFGNVDPDRITQVLVNLIGNAIKFIPVKGNVSVTLTDYLQGKYFEVCVRDNGPGMAKEDADKIFNRFVQARILKGPGDHGTGLGLSIAREILNLHGGQIWVETEQGKGCAFYFRLPKYSTYQQLAADENKKDPAEASINLSADQQE